MEIVSQQDENHCIDILKNMKLNQPVEQLCEYCHATMNDDTWEEMVIGCERVFMRMICNVGIIVHIRNYNSIAIVTQMNVLINAANSYYHHGWSVPLSRAEFGKLLASIDTKHANWELTANRMYDLYQSICPDAIQRLTN